MNRRPELHPGAGGRPAAHSRLRRQLLPSRHQGDGRGLAEQGYACLALNTKGHDTVWAEQGAGRYYGNALEILDNSRSDLRAGIDYLWEKGYRSIGILGHSMGAVKVGYYAANENDDRVAAVIPISPVRLSYSYYMESEDAEEFRGIIEQADQLEAEDKAQELMESAVPHRPDVQRLFLPGQARAGGAV